MTIRLQIEVTSPLNEDDHEMLSGIAVMTLAIANRHLTEARFPEMFSKTEEENEAARPGPFELADADHVKVVGQPRVLCGAFQGDLVCVKPVKHNGRHTLRNEQTFLRAQEALTGGGAN